MREIRTRITPNTDIFYAVWSQSTLISPVTERSSYKMHKIFIAEIWFIIKWQPWILKKKETFLYFYFSIVCFFLNYKVCKIASFRGFFALFSESSFELITSGKNWQDPMYTYYHNKILDFTLRTWKTKW